MLSLRRIYLALFRLPVSRARSLDLVVELALFSSVLCGYSQVPVRSAQANPSGSSAKHQISNSRHGVRLPKIRPPLPVHPCPECAGSDDPARRPPRGTEARGEATEKRHPRDASGSAEAVQSRATSVVVFFFYRSQKNIEWSTSCSQRMEAGDSVVHRAWRCRVQVAGFFVEHTKGAERENVYPPSRPQRLPNTHHPSPSPCPLSGCTTACRGVSPPVDHLHRLRLELFVGQRLRCGVLVVALLLRAVVV